MERRLQDCAEHVVGSRRTVDEYQFAGTFERPDDWDDTSGNFHTAVQRPDGRRKIPWFNAPSTLTGGFIEVHITKDNLKVTSRNWDARARNSDGEFVPDFDRPIGSTPPVLVCPEPDGNWQSENVTIGCTANDIHGLDCVGDLACSNAYAGSFSLSTQVPAGSETDAAATTSYEVCDVWGGCAIAGPVAGFKIDMRPPTVNAPADISVEATAPDSMVDIGVATAIDSGSGTDGVTTSDADPTGFPIGTTVVTWTAADNVGNVGTAEQRIIVADTTPPVITAPPGVTISASREGEPIGTATATDAVGVQVISKDAPNMFPPGETVVTWYAMDMEGNLSSATQVVTAKKKGGGAFGFGEFLFLLLFLFVARRRHLTIKPVRQELFAA